MSYTCHISPGNRKLGSIPSFSLPSGLTCSKEACATCYHDCYYRKHVERPYRSARENAQQNYEMALHEPNELERALNRYFDAPNSPRLFRLHVGGDFFSAAYFEMWLRVIRAHPGTHFLAFTKQFDIIAPYIDALPDHLSLILSAWPGVPLPEALSQRLPIAWMQDGTEDRVPTDAIPCSGLCTACGQCWALQGKHVVFHKH